MIELKNVSKEYGKSGKRAVDNLSLTVREGELFGFIGPNGAGKTTTIRMLIGALAPTEGQILVDGIDMAVNPLEAKKRIGFVPDGADLFDRLTGLEYLNFIGDMYEVPARERKDRSSLS